MPTTSKKQLIARKPGNPRPKSPGHVQEIVIPSADFDSKVTKAIKLSEQLTSQKKQAKDKEALLKNAKYKSGLAAVGDLLGHIFAVSQSTQGLMSEALVRLRLVISTDKDEKQVREATKLSQQVAGASKQLIRANQHITDIKNSPKGLPIEQVKSVLSGLSETVLRAMKLRTLCVQLYQKVPQKLSQRKQIILPKFHVLDGFTVIGEPTTKQDRKVTDKLAMAIQMGADQVPDPYTVLWLAYADKGVKLTDSVRKAVRYTVLWSAAHKPFPKRPTLLELYDETGLDSAGRFKYAGLNRMFKAVLGNIVRKMAGKECKEFVLAADHSITEQDYTYALAHVAQETSHGKKLLDDIRVVYAKEVVNWFNTYLPVL